MRTGMLVYFGDTSENAPIYLDVKVLFKLLWEFILIMGEERRGEVFAGAHPVGVDSTEATLR